MVTSDGETERKATVEMHLYTELHVGLFECYQTCFQWAEMREWSAAGDKYHNQLKEKVQNTGFLNNTSAVQKEPARSTQIENWRNEQNRRVSFTSIQIVSKNTVYERLYSTGNYLTDNFL